jgi:hypothetical protein
MNVGEAGASITTNVTYVHDDITDVRDPCFDLYY